MRVRGGASVTGAGPRTGQALRSSRAPGADPPGAVHVDVEAARAAAERLERGEHLVVERARPAAQHPAAELHARRRRRAPDSRSGARRPSRAAARRPGPPRPAARRCRAAATPPRRRRRGASPYALRAARRRGRAAAATGRCRRASASRGGRRVHVDHPLAAHQPDHAARADLELGDLEQGRGVVRPGAAGAGLEAGALHLQAHDGPDQLHRAPQPALVQRRGVEALVAGRPLGGGELVAVAPGDRAQLHLRVEPLLRGSAAPAPRARRPARRTPAPERRAASPASAAWRPGTARAGPAARPPSPRCGPSPPP